jgi:hypothetical protein
MLLLPGAVMQVDRIKYDEKKKLTTVTMTEKRHVFLCLEAEGGGEGGAGGGAAAAVAIRAATSSAPSGNPTGMGGLTGAMGGLLLAGGGAAAVKKKVGGKP